MCNSSAVLGVRREKDAARLRCPKLSCRSMSLVFVLPSLAGVDRVMETVAEKGHFRRRGVFLAKIPHTPLHIHLVSCPSSEAPASPRYESRQRGRMKSSKTLQSEQPPPKPRCRASAEGEMAALPCRGHC